MRKGARIALIFVTMGLVWGALDFYLASRIDDLNRTLEGQIQAGLCTVDRPCEHSLEADVCNAIASGPLPLFAQTKAAVARVPAIARTPKRCPRNRSRVQFVRGPSD